MRIYDLNKDDDSEDDDIRHFGDVEKDPDEESDTDEDDGNKKKVREALWFILYIAIIVVVAFIIVKFIGQRTVVSGRSMENTLSDGDNLIMDKITYRISNPKRFDIVIFPDPSDPSEYFIKRVIGLPGETVRIGSDGTIYINGKKLTESYGKEVINNPGLAASPITLGKDEYFVLGDNRNDSLDSRFPEVGPIKGDEILGRAVFRIYPFNHMKGLVPKR